MRIKWLVTTDFNELIAVISVLRIVHSDVGNGICNEECDLPTSNYDYSDCVVLSTEHSSETKYLSSEHYHSSATTDNSSDEDYLLGS